MEIDQAGLSGLPEFCPPQGHIRVSLLRADSFLSLVWRVRSCLPASHGLSVLLPVRSKPRAKELLPHTPFADLHLNQSNPDPSTCISTKAPQAPGLWGKNDHGNFQKMHTGVRQTYFKSARRDPSERKVRNSLEEFLYPGSGPVSFPSAKDPTSMASDK